MDPLSALSLASNVIQFVDFGARLVSGSREIYASADGSSSGNSQLEILTKDLTQVCSELVQPEAYIDQRDASQAERALVPLCRSCRQLGGELLSILQSLKVKSPHKRWETFRQALRSACKESKIRSYERRLGDYRSQIATHLLSILQVQSPAREAMRVYAHQEELLGAQSAVAKTLDKLFASHLRLEVAAVSEVATLRRDLVTLLSDMSLHESDQTSRTKFASLGVLQSQLSALPTKARTLAKDLKIIDSLCFPTISERQQRIVEAHPNTYDWLFFDYVTNGRVRNEQAQASVLDWLRNHNGIYWVSGKAGSGKSTLMKYLFNHGKTLQALRQWSGEKQLITAHFFFWNAGTEMQKSQQGLLQTLIYHVLRQCPSLIREICPSWCHGPELTRIVWTRPDLLSIFQNLRKHSIESAKFCFFIDGLDEYEGDHKEIIETIDSFASASGIKVVISSRPWVVFEDAYGHNLGQKLRLQDFTRPDIEFFVTDKLTEDRHFKELEHSDKRYQSLVTEIVDRANGVFLWVFLVVQSLRRGLTNSDTVFELQERLRMLPTDLEVYFMHMLNAVEKLYHRQAARLFLMRLATPTSLAVVTASYFDEKDPNFALSARITETKPWYPAEFDHIQRTASKRVKARCTDLLEISGDVSSNVVWIDFLHRTVRDFLETKDIQNMLIERAGVDFDVHQYFCNAMLSQMKRLPQERGQNQVHRPLDFLVNDFMYHAHQIDLNNGCINDRLMEDLQSTIVYFHGKALPYYQRVWPSLFLEDGCQEGWIIYLAIYYGLYSYVCSRSDQVRKLIETGGTRTHSSLSLALRLPGRVESRRPENHAELDARMVDEILKQGASPNETFNGEPVWVAFLLSLSPEDMSSDLKRTYLTVTEKLFRHGARVTSGLSELALKSYLSRSCTNEELAYLQDLIDFSERPKLQKQLQRPQKEPSAGLKIKKWLSRR